MIKPIAFYLPQYYPIPENDEWWGKGFTEWTNVTKAKPLFKGHQQPFLPKDLGFYDLRCVETQIAQAELAKFFGIGAFCYWHYWFGNGKVILERPIWQMHKNKDIDLPFCLAWANETWSGKWHGLDDKILVRQEYPGLKDFKDFFYYNLPLFRDGRYLKYNDRLVFFIYKPFDDPSIKCFIETYKTLAQENGLPDFYFIALNADEGALNIGFNAFSSVQPRINSQMKIDKIFDKISMKVAGVRVSNFMYNGKFNGPDIYDYKKFVEGSFNNQLDNFELPTLLPNWDNTPRSGSRGIVLKGSTPALFRSLIQKMKNSNSNKMPILIKSWNEWAEGNVLEPSTLFGREYLKVIKDELS
jgi:hypothetical protein